VVLTGRGGCFRDGLGNAERLGMGALSSIRKKKNHQSKGKKGRGSTGQSDGTKVGLEGTARRWCSGEGAGGDRTSSENQREKKLRRTLEREGRVSPERKRSGPEGEQKRATRKSLSQKPT